MNSLHEEPLKYMIIIRNGYLLPSENAQKNNWGQ